MTNFDAIEIIWSTFINNKMRTVLTVFGVSIGMGAIVFLVSFGYGVQQLTVNQISSSKALMTLSLTAGSSQIIRLNQKKTEEIANLPEIEQVGRSYAFSGHLFSGKSETDIMAYAVDNDYLSLEGLRYQTGKEYSDEKSDRTLIISSSAVSALGFGSPEEAIGKEIEVVAYYSADDPSKSQKIKLSVVAVVDDSESNLVYLPIEKLKVPDNVDYSTVKAKIVNTEVSTNARKKLEEMGLKVYSVAEMINNINKIFEIFRWVLFGFGMIALIVASLGMFNTMTISLLERTREIGIMKALGATSGGIYKLFLLEAVTIGTAGGAFGVLLGWFMGVAVNGVVSQLAIRLGGEKLTLFSTPPSFALIVFGFSLFVGFLTGFYPARRASKLNALDSLRYE